MAAHATTQTFPWGGRTQLLAALIGVTLWLCVGPAQSYPYPRRYVAVPLEDVQLIREVRQSEPPPAAHGHQNHRYSAPGPRSAHRPGPDPHSDQGQQAEAFEADEFAPERDQARNRFERQTGVGGNGGGGGDVDQNEYVDYGAHTGHHGAFGWYADFPAISRVPDGMR